MISLLYFNPHPLSILFPNSTLKFALPNKEPKKAFGMDITANGSSHANGVANEKEKHKDLELNPVPSAHLINDIVQSFGWQGMNVTVKDRLTKQPLFILRDANGLVKARELIAIMGPSQCVKELLMLLILLMNIHE